MTKKKAIEAASGIDPQHDVRQFMAIAGQAIPERPQWPDQERPPHSPEEKGLPR